MYSQEVVPRIGDRLPVVPAERFYREKWTDFTRVCRGAVQQLLVGYREQYQQCVEREPEQWQRQRQQQEQQSVRMAGSRRRKVASPPLIELPAPPAEGWSGHRLFTLENLYRAYRRCRRRKRGTINALAFEQRLEDNLIALHQELTSGRYCPGPFIAFLLEKPKRREIFAADFRDRVVHHVLVGHLEPLWERRFIHDSFACRQGKGTLAGVERVRAFTRKVTANGTRPAWYLQLDVRNFFMSLDRLILWQRLSAQEQDPAVLWLIERLLFQDPTANCRLRGARRCDFDRLPREKSLFHAPETVGLPIGNLTSQFWANVYLDSLDQFIKHKLKARFYVRYCDDMVLLSDNWEQLLTWEREIEQFLGEQLCLSLNQRRKLRPVNDGIDFLGYIVRPDYLLVRRRVVGALRERLERTQEQLHRQGMIVSPEKRSVFPWQSALLLELQQWLNSYLGYLRKASTYRLVQRLQQQYPWLAEYVEWQGWKVVSRYPSPRFATRFRDQERWYRTRLSDHVLLIQRGVYWQISLPRPLIQSKSVGVHDGLKLRQGFSMTSVEKQLWESGDPVAWISQTGRRISTIAERELTVRWSGHAKGNSVAHVSAPNLARTEDKSVCSKQSELQRRLSPMR